MRHSQTVCVGTSDSRLCKNQLINHDQSEVKLLTTKLVGHRQSSYHSCCMMGVFTSLCRVTAGTSGPKCTGQVLDRGLSGVVGSVVHHFLQWDRRDSNFMKRLIGREEQVDLV